MRVITENPSSLIKFKDICLEKQVEKQTDFSDHLLKILTFESFHPTLDEIEPELTVPMQEEQNWPG
jgi:hypothetical protein